MVEIYLEWRSKLARVCIMPAGEGLIQKGDGRTAVAPSNRQPFGRQTSRKS